MSDLYEWVATGNDLTLNVCPVARFRPAVLTLEVILNRIFRTLASFGSDMLQ